MILRSGHREVVEHSLDHRGGEFLRGQPVAAGEHLRHGLQMRAAGGGFFHQRGDHVLIERFARRARLLRAVEHGDFLHGSRQGGDKALAVKRTIQPHFQQADLFAFRDEVLHGLVGGLAAGPHQHHDALRVFRTGVVEQIVAAPGQRGKFVHDLLDDVGAGGIEAVRRLTALEEHVGILRRAAQHRLVGRHRVRAVRGDDLVVNQRADHRLVEHFNLGNLMRCAEAVEEMDERQP